MRKRTQVIWTSVVWGSLGAGGLTFAADPAVGGSTDTTANDNAASGRSQQDASATRDAKAGGGSDLSSAGRPQGSSEASDQSLKEVRNFLGKAAEAVMSEDGIARVSPLLSRQDRERMGGKADQDPKEQKDAQGADASALKERVRQFRQDWKEKYGREFAVQNREVVFSGVRVDTAGRRDSATADAGSADASDNDARQAGARRKAAAESTTDDADQRANDTRSDPTGTPGVENAPARDAATFEKRVSRANSDDARAARGAAPLGQASERSKPGDAEEQRTGQVQVAADETGGAIPTETKLPVNGSAPARSASASDAAKDASPSGSGSQGDDAATDSDRRGSLNDAASASAREGTADEAAHAGHGASSGRSLAVVIPPPRGAQDVHLRLVKEAEGWRIDVPDTMDRNELLASLGRHLDAVQREKDNWPDNADDAARLVSQHVLMAFAETSQGQDHGNGSRTPETSR